MDFSIIIINYKTYDLTRNCIESIIHFSKNNSFEIILIDNCSQDGSFEKFKNDFENVENIKIYQMDKNYGTSKSFNFGVSNSIGKYILWLNSDTIFIQDSLKIAFDVFENNSVVGVLGGNLINKDNKPMHSYQLKMPNPNTIKKDYSIFSKIFSKNKIKQQYNFSKKNKEVGYITGADLFVRKEVFDKIGLFDEEIFMYGEETDFQFRLKKYTNYDIISVPNIRIIHLEGASSKYTSNVKLRKFQRFHDGYIVFLQNAYGDQGKKIYLKNYIKILKRKKNICKLLKLRQDIFEIDEMIKCLQNYY